MPNKLAQENSPYLLQHAQNPINWYPWGDEALTLAKSKDKPIFLSIGYAACHWCHVMAHESFEDPEIAAIMNQHFISIKVDREERPDLDSIYMSAVVSMTGSGGWPMSVFLTPDGQPFFGGTYFPPVRRYNMPSFGELLITIARLWRDDRSHLLESGNEITQHLLSLQNYTHTEGVLQKELLEEATMRLAQTYDWQNGGWGSAPKFPQPMVIEYLLRRMANGDKLAQDIVIHVLDSMAKGGMYDVVGGGFARYSTDNQWLIPHFEKMLYDNAQLARVYLYAFLVTGAPRFRSVCEETLDFISRELCDNQSPGAKGGFYSSLDADSEGGEGKYYIWNQAEIRSAIEGVSIPGYSTTQMINLLFEAYAVTSQGNFEGNMILQRTLDDESLAQQLNIERDEVEPLLIQLLLNLRRYRDKRVRPSTDDKILVSWNALALSAFSEAARYLDRPDYLEIAKRNADFLITELRLKDLLMRSWRNGQARHLAYLEDYAGLILGLMDLYQSDPDLWWYQSAVDLAKEMIKHYTDPSGGFFDTRDDAARLILRPKDLQDNATPSGNAMAAMALVQLSALTGNDGWRSIAEKMLLSIQVSAKRYPTAFGKWLCAIDFTLHPIHEVVILGEFNHPSFGDMKKALWNGYRPNLIACMSPYPPPPNSPLLLHDRPLLNNLTTAYVCHNFICQKPTNLAGELASILIEPFSGIAPDITPL